MVIDNTVDYIHHISSKKKTVSKWQMPGSLMVLLAITLALQTVAGHSDSLQDPEGCYQRMLRWLDGRDENKNATLLAMVLGMTISSSLVASGLAVWLCGVGWRAAHGPGAHPSCQSTAEREDHRNHATCPRTRNPQRKGGYVGETDIYDHGADPTLSEPPTLDGASAYRTTRDGGRAAAGVRCWPTERSARRGVITWYLRWEVQHVVA